MRNRSLPGRHITDCQMRLYMSFRQADSTRALGPFLFRETRDHRGDSRCANGLDRLNPNLTCQQRGSNVWGIRGSSGGDIPIERRGRYAAAVRDLNHADVGMASIALGGLDVVVREFQRTASRAANAPRSGEARLGALSDQAAKLRSNSANAPNM
jgi:hypothetical protein